MRRLNYLFVIPIYFLVGCVQIVDVSSYDDYKDIVGKEYKLKKNCILLKGMLPSGKLHMDIAGESGSPEFINEIELGSQIDGYEVVAVLPKQTLIKLNAVRMSKTPFTNSFIYDVTVPSNISLGIIEGWLIFKYSYNETLEIVTTESQAITGNK